ncbi:3-deoxy-8-phosphooctulonate synthase [Rhodobacteraceae bacterium CCMM004]|nr:3-deoxy-8-phosphooctulonate synthase [Rhodobacteraceae bacterium CCMM004]
MHDIALGAVRLGNAQPLVLIAGPCQLETADHAQAIAGRMAEICAQHGVGYVFKASFDKANRTSVDGARGPGRAAGLEMLAQVGRAVGVPVTTDVHSPDDCAEAAEAVDLLQIPAFLCRQTDLLLAAAATGRPVNVKKGQFLAPWDMANVVDKLRRGGCADVAVTERGASFGYNRLVADMTGLAVMAETGCPVIMDATHAVQAPGGLGAASGGTRGMAPILARAAVAVGVAGVFMEVHEDPDRAPSDGPVMQRLDTMPATVAALAALDRVAKAL